MKMKKILSLLVSSALAFSAFTAMVSAYDKKGTVTIAATEVERSLAEQYMTALNMGSIADGYGVYQLVVNVGDLGSFSFTKTSGILGTTYSGTAIAGLQLQLAGQNVKSMAVLTAEDTTKLPVSAATLENGVQYSFAAGSASAAFPKVTTTSDNYAADFTALVYAPNGTELTAGGKTLVAFNNAGAWADNTTYELTVTPVKLGEKQDAKKALGLTIDGTDAKKENGYIWKLGLTQENGAKADSFTADFKDNTGLTNTKTARNNVADFFGGEGTVEFYVGLKTARTITEFKATVADSTAEGVTASDTWNAE